MFAVSDRRMEHGDSSSAVMLSFAALSYHLPGRHSTTSLRSTAKTSGSRVSRRCVTASRYSATISLSCVNERRKNRELTERRYIVLYRLNVGPTVIKIEVIFCACVAAVMMRHDKLCLLCNIDIFMLSQNIHELLTCI